LPASRFSFPVSRRPLPATDPLDLVPAHVRNLWREEPCDLAGDESDPGIRARRLLAAVEEHLHPKAHTQTRPPVGERGANVFLRATHRGDRGSERSDARKNQDVGLKR